MGRNKCSVLKLNVCKKSFVAFNKIATLKRGRKNNHSIFSTIRKHPPKNIMRPAIKSPHPKAFFFGGRLSFATLTTVDDVFVVLEKNLFSTGLTILYAPSGLLKFRSVCPVYSCRGLPILYSGPSIISSQWAIHPAVRATAKITVNMLKGTPMALRINPE